MNNHRVRSDWQLPAIQAPPLPQPSWTLSQPEENRKEDPPESFPHPPQKSNPVNLNTILYPERPSDPPPDEAEASLTTWLGEKAETSTTYCVPNYEWS